MNHQLPLNYGVSEVHLSGPTVALLLRAPTERCAVDMSPEQARRLAMALLAAAESAGSIANR